MEEKPERSGDCIGDVLEDEAYGSDAVFFLSIFTHHFSL